MTKVKIDNLECLNDVLEQLSIFLEGCDIDIDDIFDSKIVTCELVTNVFRHTDGVATAEWGVEDGYIHISVTSNNQSGQEGVINPQLPDVFAESGRGLYIVQSICEGEIKTKGGTIKVKIKIN